jgi:uncharacterized protein (UPF0548 family)
MRLGRGRETWDERDALGEGEMHREEKIKGKGKKIRMRL